MYNTIYCNRRVISTTPPNVTDQQVQDLNSFYRLLYICRKE